ncbi:hypothetical protein [Thermus sediminis]|uniref:hypothetical protein n=1 Tax=Thermus sediminis TaxID=1761908 RepID=UPI001E3479A3|nr:hypothetical protein [Thermus sediminis]
MSRGLLAAGSARVSEMVATLPSHLQRPFHQAEALYRFLANPRVGAEALLERVCRESALALEGEEVLVFLDLSPVRKPHARALEGIARVGRKRETGYELLTALGMDVQGRLALGYAHLVAYGERGFASLPREVERAIAGARGVLGGEGRRLVYVADRGFDDRKVFGQVLGCGAWAGMEGGGGAEASSGGELDTGFGEAGGVVAFDQLGGEGGEGGAAGGGDVPEAVGGGGVFPPSEGGVGA